MARTTNVNIVATATSWAVTIFALSASVTGILSMVSRSGRSESITLAVSTIAAFLLLILAL